jgi:hypothetical protein
VKRKTFFILVFIIIVVWVIASVVFADNLGQEIRFVNDYYDRFIYAERAMWFTEGKIPYVDVFSEYPQVPTYLFALPYLVLNLLQYPVVSDILYSATFSLLMLIFLGWTIILLKKLLLQLKKNSNLAFLLFLPAPLYFSFNRFDILPALIVLGSVLFFFKEKRVLSAVLLAVGAMTKWYPALLLPVFLVGTYYKTKRINWAMLLAFGMTCILIILPTYFSGGWSAVLIPYRSHLGRGLEFVSLPALLQNRFFLPLGIHIESRLIESIFLILQFFPALISPMIQLKRKDEILNWSLIVIGLFVFFSEIYSPQWILWLLPFLISVAKTKKDIWLLSIFSASVYVAFPIIFDGMGRDSTWMAVISLFNFALLFSMLISSAKRLKVRWVFNTETLANKSMRRR